MADAVAERADRMRAFCISLRSISAAIIDGEIDETNAFDALVEGKGPPVENPIKGPPLPATDETEELKDRMRPAPGLSEAKRIGLPAHEPVTGESITKPVTKRDVTEPPLSKPKRKRTRARS